MIFEVCKCYIKNFMFWAVVIIEVEINFLRYFRNFFSFYFIIVINILFRIVLLFSWEYKEIENNMYVLCVKWIVINYVANFDYFSKLDFNGFFYLLIL